MSFRQILSFFLIIIISSIIIGAGLAFVPLLSEAVQGDYKLVISVGGGFFFAFIIYLFHSIISQSLLEDETKVTFDPMKIARNFSALTIGKTDEAAIAMAVGDVIEKELKARRSGILRVLVQETGFRIEPMPGRGQLPAEPFDLARTNTLLVALTTGRKPIRHDDLDMGKMLPPEKEALAQLGVHAYAPIFDGGMMQAILVAGPKDNGRPYYHGELEVLGILATQAEAALKTARTIADLQNLNESIITLNESLKSNNESLEKMNAARNDFLAVASHELKTPITQMLGYADFLGTIASDTSMPIDAATIADLTGNIVKACGRLNEVVNQMLDMAQLDVNAMELKYGDVSLELVLKNALEPFANAIRERRITLKLSGVRVLPVIRGDSGRLTQAFWQLTSNAVKFTPDGGKIEIAARTLPLNSATPTEVEIVFADGGIGIDPKFHQLIFEKFYRIGSASSHSTSTTKFMGGGPGLGLPIAKGVVERHGGKIWIESTGEDKEKFPGSKFHVTLPIKPPAFSPKAIESSPPGSKPPPLPSGKNPFVGM